MSPPSTLLEAIRSELEAALGETIELESSRSIGGGSINAAARVETSAGPMFVKHATHRDARFSVEARQLEALAASGTPLTVMAPLAWRDASAEGPGFLVARFIEAGPRRADFDAALGQGLAELHVATAPAFGFEIDTFCGSTPQPNPWTESWVDFYREHRLRHQLRLLVDAGLLGPAERRAFEHLLDRLDQELDASEPPALIHGDLWSGNLLVTADGRPALVDPASYFAHREAELGMMALFGGFSPRVYAAYEAARPLPSGWRERMPLYQLWHVANHATLFGGGYVDDTMRIVSRYA